MLFELVLLVLDFRDLLPFLCREMRIDQARTVFLFLRVRGDGLMAMATTKSDVRGPTPGADAWTLAPPPPTHTGRRPLTRRVRFNGSGTRGTEKLGSRHRRDGATTGGGAILRQPQDGKNSPWPTQQLRAHGSSMADQSGIGPHRSNSS